jgi:hypothetical protein
MWITFVTLDNLYVSTWFLYKYYTHKNIRVGEKEDWLRSHSLVYHDSWFVDRYVYYALLEPFYVVLTSLEVVSERFLFWCLVLLHTPFCFNRLVKKTFSTVFSTFSQIRYGILKVVFLKFVADLSRLTPFDQKRFIIHFEYIDSWHIFMFLIHYIINTILGFLYRVSWKLYPVFKLASYYYFFKYKYLFGPMTVQQAHAVIQSTIGVSWESMHLPRFSHAVYIVSNANRQVEKKWARWVYKLSILSCIWTFAELSQSYIIMFLVSILFQLDKSFQLSLDTYIHIISLCISPIIGMLLDSYFIGACLCTFPAIHSILRYILFAYFSVKSKYESISDFYEVAHNIEERNDRVTENVYSDIVEMPFSRYSQVKCVAEPIEDPPADYIILQKTTDRGDVVLPPCPSEK